MDNLQTPEHTQTRGKDNVTFVSYKKNSLRAVTFSGFVVACGILFISFFIRE